MLTTSHMLMGAAVTARMARSKWQIAAGWLGGFAPDASVYVVAGVAMLQGKGGAGTWRRPDGLYWQEPWQTLSAISNSIPFWLVFLVIAILVARGATRLIRVAHGATIFFAGGLLHVVADFFTHADDAHMHFWPITDWRFNSPVSYYQRAHHGELFSIFELGLCVVLAWYLVRTFKQWPVRVMAVLMAVVPVLMYVIAGIIFQGG